MAEESWIQTGGTGERQCRIDNLIMQGHSAGKSQLLSPHIVKKELILISSRRILKKSSAVEGAACVSTRHGLGESIELLLGELNKYFKYRIVG